MKEFQEYTQDHRAARRRRWIWSVPAGLVVALLVVGVGMRVGAVPVPMQPLGYEGGGVRGDAARGQSGEDPGSWVRQILGGREPAVSGGPLNVLVLGVDENPGETSEDGEVAQSGSRSDTIMLVQVAPETGEVKLLSVPRDFLVEVEPGVEDKINAAYSYGGIEQAMRAVEGYTGVPVEHYAAIDFEGFEEVIDAMGGVEVDVRREDFPDRWRHLEDGIQTLDGRMALKYARYRGTAGGDLDRIERQQELVAALRSKALGWNTATKIPEIVKIMNEHVETDLGLDEAVFVGRALVREGRDARMTSTQLEGTPKTLPDGNEVLVPDDAANEAKLRQFRY